MEIVVRAFALATAPMALLIMASSYVSSRWPRATHFLEGAPVVVVRDGVLLDDVLHLEHVPLDEVLQAARKEGISDLADVEWCILEPDGHFSFLVKQRKGTAV
jgi:uncharacterized membrane protein YcaP (DUF421 family)